MPRPRPVKDCNGCWLRINGGNPRIIFDMREVTLITSAGLRAVLVTAKQAAAANGGLAIFGVQIRGRRGLRDFRPEAVHLDRIG